MNVAMRRPGRISISWAMSLFCLFVAVVAVSVSMGGIPRSGETSTDGSALPESLPQRGDLLVVVGSPGTEEYQEIFREWAERWRAAGETGLWRVQVLVSAEATLAAVRESIQNLQPDGEEPIWLVLIGHGTDDGRSARFNLDGPDLEPAELADLLKSITRPLAVINCASASAPFLQPLAGPDRVVITATKSGAEVNFARFGDGLSRSLNDAAADLDKDGQTSLLEAFLRACRLTAEFYESQGRLQTEHALLDDNGDGLPVPGEGFSGVRPVQRAEATDLLPDGVIAHQWHLVPNDQDRELSPEVLARRNRLEQQIAALRNRKSTLETDEYYAQLEVLFLELAELIIPQEPVRPVPETAEEQPETSRMDDSG